MDKHHTRSPLALGGDKFRIPLRHPEIEPIGKKIEALLRLPNLTQDDGGSLTGMYRDLYRVDRALFGTFGAKPLSSSAMRPDFPDDAGRPSSPLFGESDLLVRIGFVRRVSEYVDQLTTRLSGMRGHDDI